MVTRSASGAYRSIRRAGPVTKQRGRLACGLARASRRVIVSDLAYGRLAEERKYLLACDMQPETAPASESPSLIYPLSSILDRLDLAKLFPGGQPLEVELGSGDSTFLVE